MTAVQLGLLDGAPPLTYRIGLERELGHRLEQLGQWNDGLEPATDWTLEALLDDVRRLAIELRMLRGEESIPF